MNLFLNITALFNIIHNGLPITVFDYAGDSFSNYKKSEVEGYVKVPNERVYR